MKSLLKSSIASAAIIVAAAVPTVSYAADATWTLNYADSIKALGYGNTLQPSSLLTDEYKYTAESLVLFKDLDGSGGISGGDTFFDVIVYRIDQLNYAGGTNSDGDYFLKNAQVSGIVIGSGTQIDAQNYVVNSSSIEFWFDSIGGVTIPGVGTYPSYPGTDASFAGNLANFTDGVLVQTGTGAGAGANALLVPDGALNIYFDLTDNLSTKNCSPTGTTAVNCGVFEQFNPFATLDQIVFQTDSNNKLCGTGGSTCQTTTAGLLAFFNTYITNAGYGNYSFSFHTRSDGSATKAVPLPGTLALLGLGLLGLGTSRRKSIK